MIEIVDAQNGEKVLRCDGRLLASRFDPQAEAAEWLARRKIFLDKVKAVFVLGLGSGHHVAALSRVFSGRILVLEVNADVIGASSGVGFKPAANVRIENVDSLRALRGLDVARDLVRESFVVLSHPAAIAMNIELYKELRALLLGREWGALNWQWNMRNGPSFDQTPRISASDRPLTIYDLDMTELVTKSEERERLLFKALRELVK